MDTELIWAQAREHIEKTLGEKLFVVFFKNVRCLGLEGESLVLEVQTEFSRKWIFENYRSLLEQALSDAAGRELSAEIVIASQPHPVPPPGESMSRHGLRAVPSPGTVQTIAPAPVNTILNPRLTFGNFVVGDSNRFSYEAALAVAEAPGAAYNPLFLYSGVGLGKTHLLQAIGHSVMEHHEGLRVTYVSTEEFLHEYIEGLRDKGRIPGFRAKYRQCDVLLIDDIQFIERGVETQEEFFHTFNELQQSGRQIAISSDRPPGAIPSLQDRLISRFKSGLTVDIQPPEVETRVAILRSKAAASGISVPDEVIDFIADMIHSSIRDLEGALNKVVLWSSLKKVEMDVDTARAVLSEIYGGAGGDSVTLEKILNECSKYYDIPVSEITGNSRRKETAYARQMAMYLARDLTSLSTPDIGSKMGGRHHTTVLHSVEKISDLISSETQAFNQVQELASRIKRL